MAKSVKLRLEVQDFVGIFPTTPVLFCSVSEMNETTEIELNGRGISQKRLDILKKHFFELLLGKYFASKNEIWIVEDKGAPDSVIIHELLHSIQKCRPNRESICDYVTFKISQDPTAMESRKRLEWQEIEKNNGLPRIIENFLSTIDCEEF
jgi:hypothetical protein